MIHAAFPTGRTARLRLPFVCALALLTAACASAPPPERAGGIDGARLSFAVQEAKALQAKGSRVWCVPFARNLSGVQIRGNAETWWPKAQGRFPRSEEPRVGAVMAFAPTGSMPMGHVAVVSKVVSPREIQVDHANWHRDRISLGMRVRDVSDANDWSAVRLESNPGAFGSVYPVNGFIVPKDG